MACEYLNPVAAIWLQSGLSHLLQPDGIEQEKAATVEVRPVPQRGPRDSSPAPEVTSPKENRKEDWRPLPVEDWPEPWRELYARTKKGRIAWTYAKLGSDLLSAAKPQTAGEEAQGRAARSQALRRILGALGHPAGTHTFWPAQLDLERKPEIEIFWSGLQAIGCRGVILLDTDYARLLCGGAKMRAYIQAKFHSQFVWPLPPIESFADADYQRLISYLRRILKPFAGIA